MTQRFLLLLIGLCWDASVYAQDESFFSDPSLLKPWDKGIFDLGYVDPDIVQKAQRYDSVMVDQPEIQIYGRFTATTSPTQMIWGKGQTGIHRL